MLESCAATQRHLDGPEKYNLMKFNKRKCKVPHLKRNNPSTSIYWEPHSQEETRQKG